jgi:hypothetical protein
VSATVANSQNLSLSMSRIKTRCQFCLLEQDFLKLIFFGSFRSVPSFGINSSVNLGMPFRVYSAEVFGNEIRCQPYSAMNSVHSSFSHDLSPPFLCPYTFSLFSLPFCSTFIPVPSSQYPYFPVTISIPLIFPFIPHTSPILSLTFSYSSSSIRSSLTLHLYALIPFSSSLIHHPLQQQKQLPVNFKKRPQHKP